MHLSPNIACYMGFWCRLRVDGSGVVNPRLGIHQNSDFCMGLIDVDQNYTLVYSDEKVPRLRALQPQHFFKPHLYKTNVKVIYFFAKSHCTYKETYVSSELLLLK